MKRTARLAEFKLQEEKIFLMTCHHYIIVISIQTALIITIYVHTCGILESLS